MPVPSVGPIRIHHACRRHPAHSPTVRRVLTGILRDHGAKHRGAVEVVLCSDRTIHRLNRTHRHIDRPTDVLSFNYDEPDLLGEIYVSLDRAAVQARRLGHSYREELQRLVVHGMFHLLGHDHARSAARSRMEALERHYAPV